MSAPIFPISSVEVKVSQFVENGDPMREKFGLLGVVILDIPFARQT